MPKYEIIPSLVNLQYKLAAARVQVKNLHVHLPKNCTHCNLNLYTYAFHVS